VQSDAFSAYKYSGPSLISWRTNVDKYAVTADRLCNAL
jgi:hypothetical protein